MSNYHAYSLTFLILLGICLLLVLVSLGTDSMCSLCRRLVNKYARVIRVNARVVRKIAHDPGVDSPIARIFGGKMSGYRMTFLINGREVELEAPLEIYQQFDTADEGVLESKGNRVIQFGPRKDCW